MFRFTIREVVLLTVIVALGISWWSDRQQISLKLEQAELRARDAANDAEWKRDMSELDSLFQEYQPGRIWTYETLVAESDMVCIGTVQSTKKVENTEFFPDFLDRFESEIRVLAALKGDSKREDLAFVHFRYRPDIRSTLGNGPTFAVLDDLNGKEAADGREAGERGKHAATFLLFLDRRPDGAYEPTCGNEDAAMGVARVDGFTDDE